MFFRLLISISASILLFSACEPAEKELPPPNILWLVSEDNSPFIGAYGDEFAKTPNIDSLASVGILYENAFAAAPVCAPSRSTLITGMYANSLGTENMRSSYPIPAQFQFFPTYLREAGYYVTNNVKKDYNTADQEGAWHESSREATYRNRRPGQPFFHIQNTTISHESSIHDPIPTEELMFDPEEVPIPPYHPQTEEMKHDWAQYYQRVHEMDAFIGDMLTQLKEDGLADSTIIFYYSDHGGVVGRSKRFMFESGLHVPLVVYFPEMYSHLAPGDPGTQTDRLVTFVDFPTTVLSLAGVDIPDHMQGKPFMGKSEVDPRDYAYSFRGRMDEKIDLVRTVRDKKFRYIRNYMPHRVYGQYIEYLWRAPSMRSWAEAYKNGELDEVQSRFFGTKPPEELYLISEDPHNIYNLVDSASHQETLQEMRVACSNWEDEIVDVGFLPEPMMERISRDTTLYAYVRKPEFPHDRILETADMASLPDHPNSDSLTYRLDDPHAAVRYWAVLGCMMQHIDRTEILEKLQEMMNNDPEVSVRIAAAEALLALDESAEVLATLERALTSDLLMARTYSLNVISSMGDRAEPLKETLEKMIASDPDSRAYDLRLAKAITKEL